MKSATTLSEVVLPIIDVFIPVAAVAFGLQMLTSKMSVAVPNITSKPANPTWSPNASFGFTDLTGATPLGQLDAAPLAPCESIKNYARRLTQGTHNLQATGTVSGLSLGVWKPIAVTISNPNGEVIYPSALNVTVGTDSTASESFSSATIVRQQSIVSTSPTVAVPANGSVVLPAQTAIAPQIHLKYLAAVNQDVCKNKSFSVSHSGTATN